MNFIKTNTKFCLSLHYNGSNSYLFVNGTEIHKFKTKEVADKITGYSKKPANESHSNDVSNEIPKERYISPQERQKIIYELRLIE